MTHKLTGYGERALSRMVRYIINNGPSRPCSRPGILPSSLDILTIIHCCASSHSASTMRFLSSDSSGKLSFAQFKANPPPYAILSHTWGQTDEEVSYAEVINGLGKEKRGYRKIEFCASQGKQDNLQYFWVDTCCIDKWNHLELSKAINSMFHWYQNAAKCYVILSDVPVPDPADIARQSAWEASFKESKWFTRGWTLQELIAPVSVEFFSFEGHLLGDKKSLEHLICETTGIPAEVLRNGGLDDFSVSDVKEWAKPRKTTEPEDQIYCLLGILNIFMTPSYGEGIDNATRRLDKELKRIDNEANFIVPYARNDKFFGYESQLAKLEDMALAGQQATKIVITGPGGIGKSQLVLELAYRSQEKHKNCAVFWISAADMDSFSQACSYVAQKLAIPGWDDENEDARKLLQLHLGRASAGKWLLIYNDVDDVSLGAGKETSPRVTTLLDFMPRSDQGSVIFTTAMSDTANILAPENTMELPQMAAETAEKILDSCLAYSRLENEEVRETSARRESFDNTLAHSVDAEEESSRKLLLEELSCLPLAITQAAAYIKHNNLSISSYLDLLSEQKGKTINTSDRQREQQLQCHAADSPVARTSLISLHDVSRHNPIAANCLFFMACVDRKDVLLQLLPTTPSSPTRTTVDLLSTYAILIKRPASSAVELHRLVHLKIRNHLQEQGLFCQWNQKAIGILAEIFPSASHENRSEWRRLLPHAKCALADSPTEQENDSTTNLARKYAAALYKDGRFDEAEKLFVQVMETCKTKLGADHPDTLTSMANLASTYRDQGRWEEAEKLGVLVVETRKSKLGADHPDTLTSMADLASTFLVQGWWREAEKLFMQVIETRKTKLGADHPDMLTSTDDLASTYRDQGRMEEAEKLFVQVMETRKTKLGADHPDTLTSIANLALTIWKQGRWEEVENLFMQVIEKSKMKLGADHPYTLTSMANLATTFWSQGRWEEAEKLLMQTIETCKTKLRADHPFMLTSMANLASTYRDQGRWEEAETLEVQVVVTSKTKFGASHPSTLTYMANLAVTYKNQGRWEEAEKLEVQVMEISKTKLGADHPDTLTSMANLTWTYRNQGRWEEVEKLEVQMVETRKTKLRPDHPDTLTSMANLALTL